MQVGHPVNSLPNVRRPDARSAQIGAPDSIAQCFQVSAYSIEPPTPILARNLFSNDDWRIALRDKAEELRPQVAGVGSTSSLTGCGERLAGTTPCPYGSVSPPCKVKGKGPAGNAAKEMALSEPSQVGRLHFNNASGVNFSGRNKSSGDEISEPLRTKFVIFIVVIHFPPLICAKRAPF